MKHESLPEQIDRRNERPTRIIAIVIVMVLLHFMVILVRRLSRKVMAWRIGPRRSKSKTITSVLTSIIIFAFYFTALGLILNRMGVSIKAYLAIGFGSQGLVQDVVNGLTIVFSGLFNVGDMVEISGQTGIVKSFGMRFTLIENSFGASVHILNRTITNVVRYPKGYIRGIADIIFSKDQELSKQMEAKVADIVSAASEQFSGIQVASPSIEGRIKTQSGKEFLRVKFRLWPGRGAPIETFFKQEIVFALRALDPNYQDWMVTVNYEVERKTLSL